MIKAFILSFTFFLVALLTLSLSTGAQYGILATPDSPSYEPGDIVEITVVVLDESTVTVQVVDSTGEVILIKSVPTEEQTVGDSINADIAVVKFRLPDDAKNGSYIYYASGVSEDGSTTGMISGNFVVGVIDQDNLDGDFIPFVPVPIIAGSAVVVAFFRKRLGE